MGPAYPFEVKGNSLRHQPSYTSVYEFCLAFTFIPSLSAKPFNRLTVAFERLARDLTKTHLGPGAEGYRTGAPPDEHEHRPPKMKAVIQHLASLAGEWVWKPHHDLPEDPAYKM